MTDSLNSRNLLKLAFDSLLSPDQDKMLTEIALGSRIENLKDMVLYRFGSTGVVQVLSRAAELLGLVPIFPVRNVNTFTSGSAGSSSVFRDCVLVKK